MPASCSRAKRLHTPRGEALPDPAPLHQEQREASPGRIMLESSNVSMHRSHPGGLDDSQMAACPPQSFRFRRSRAGPRVCLSNRVLGDADVGPGPHLRTAETEDMVADGGWRQEDWAGNSVGEVQRPWGQRSGPRLPCALPVCPQCPYSVSR